MDLNQETDDRDVQNAESVVENARGDIDEELLTETGEGGIVSNGELAGRPAISYLEPDEQLQYLLSGEEGLTVQRPEGVQTAADVERVGVYRTQNASRAATLVTSDRIVFLVGQRDENHRVSLQLADVEAVKSDDGLMHQKLVVEDDRYTYSFKTGRHAEVTEAVEYLRGRMQELPESTEGLTPGEDEAFPELVGEYTDGSPTLESATRGDVDAVRGDIAWLTDVHTELATEWSETTTGESRPDEGADHPLHSALTGVETLLSTLHKVENVLTDAHEETEQIDSFAVAAAIERVEGTPIDDSALDELRSAEGDTTERDDELAATDDEPETERKTGADSETDDPFTTPDVEEPDDDGEPETETAETDPQTRDSGTERSEMAAESPHLSRELQRLSEQLGRLPTRADVESMGQYDAGEFKQFGGEWRTVLEAAGYDYRGRLIESLQAIDDRVGGRVKLTDLQQHGKYDREQFVEVFGSWTDALFAADVLDRESEMIDELQRLEGDLEKIPNGAEIREHGAFSLHEYQQEFGSLQESYEAAGFDLEGEFLDQVEAVAEALDHPPTTVEFEDHSPYASGIAYKYFDSWSDAQAAAGVTESIDKPTPETEGTDPEDSVDAPDPSEGETERTETDDVTSLTEEIDETLSESTEITSEEEPSSTEDDQPARNELAELYETMSSLSNVQRAVYDGLAADDTVPDDDPGAEWVSLVRSVVGQDGLADWDAGYGPQQADRNDHTMDEYRTTYGDGDTVEEFTEIETARRPASTDLIASTDTPDLERLPIAPDSSVPLPVVVTSTAELDRARALLEEFPGRPAADSESSSAATTERDTAQASGTDDDSGEETTSGGAGAVDETESEDSGSEETESIESLTDVSGVDEEVAQKLVAADYHDRSDLRSATDQELSEIDGINEGRAFRIKLDVGGS